MMALRVPGRLHHRLLPSSPFFPSPLCPSKPHPTDPFSLSIPPAPFPRRRIRRICGRAGGGHPARDPNAESVRPGRFRFRDAVGGGVRGGGDGKQEEAEDGEGWGYRRKGKRRWWSDELNDDELDDEAWDVLDDEVEQPWEKVWIFKVFKSYGFLLPAIVASMLLATGPKAFLMAMALPLGQSVLSLAIDKLWGNASKATRPKSKSKRKPFTRSASDFRREEEEELGGGYPGREAYRSWMAADAVASDAEGKSRTGAFAGWDELDGRREYVEAPRQRQQPKTGFTSVSRTSPTRKGKMSRKDKSREMPLLLRLLIAVFPFLGSWTRML